MDVETYIVLTEPDRDGQTVLKSNHTVLPIANMITQNGPKYSLAQVESVEIHVISIDKTIAMVIDDNSARLRVHRLAGHEIRQDAIQPGRIGSHIVFRREVERAIIEMIEIAAAQDIDLLQVRKQKWGGDVCLQLGGVEKGREVESGVGVVQLRLKVGGQVELILVEINQRGCLIVSDSLLIGNLWTYHIW